MSGFLPLVAAIVSVVVASPPQVGRDRDSPAVESGTIHSRRDVTVTTANIAHTLGPVRARADLARAMRGSDVVATQEMGGRRYAVPGWGRVQPRRMPCAEDAVYYRHPLQRVRSRAVVLARGRGIRRGTRCAVSVTLEGAGRRFTVVGFHALPHVERAGRPRRDRPRRVAVYAAGMARLDDLRRRLATPYVIAGDANVARRPDCRIRWSGFPCSHLEAGTLEARNAGTRGGPAGRDIDRLWCGRADWRIVGHRVIRRTYSDHAFARVTLERR